MRSNCNHLSIIPRAPFLALGYGSLLALAPLGDAFAQDQGAPADSSSATSPANAPTSSTATPALPADAVPPVNPNDVSRAQVPGVSQSPVNPQPTNIPAYPAQLGNPLSPYNSSSVNPQNPQLTQPTQFVTGVRDISSISTNAALSAAFSQPVDTGDFTGEDTGPNYEHPPIERIRLGPFDLRAAMVTSVVADDNYQGNGGNGNNGAPGTGAQGKKGDFSFAFTPAINLIYGAHDGQRGFASLIYSPTLTRLYHNSENDTDDQNVAFNVIYPFNRLTLNLTETYTESSGVNTDSNQRTTQNTSATTFGGTYEVDEKLSVSSQVQELDSTFSGANGQGNNGNNANGNNNGNDVGGQGGTTTTVNNAINYRLSEKLTLGPNLNVGWDRPDDEKKSTYEQALIALNYTPTEKIGMYAQGGTEFRQYDQGGGDKVNPIFALGVGYNPFDSTSFQLSASETVHTSTAELGQATAGQQVVSTQVGAGVTQRIVQRVFVSFTFNYEHNDNSGEGGGGGGGATGPDTTEDTYTYRPYITFAPTAWSSISLYYQYLGNESEIPGQSYNDNQVGFSVSAQF